MTGRRQVTSRQAATASRITRALSRWGSSLSSGRSTKRSNLSASSSSEETPPGVATAASGVFIGNSALRDTMNSMQLGMIGLGRMGANMVRRLSKGGQSCVVFDLNATNVKQLADEGAT